MNKGKLHLAKTRSEEKSRRRRVAGGGLGEQHPFPSTLAHNAVSGQLGFQPEQNWLVDGEMGWENVFGSSFDCLVANLQIDENAPHNYSSGSRTRCVDWSPWDLIINFFTSILLTLLLLIVPFLPF